MAKRLFWLILFLLAFGLAVLASASVVQATKQFGSASYFWRHQLIYGILPGLALLWIAWKFGYRRVRPFAFGFLVAALALMVLVVVPQFGLKLKGATSWLVIGGMSFQPAEFLKLALVVYLAAWLGERSDRVKRWQLGLLPFGIIMGFVATLLLLQPDLGTLGVVALIASGMYFLAGAPVKQTAAIILVGMVLVVGFAALSSERWQRITTLLDPTLDARGAGWQLNQALIAIGSGGIWGVGYGQSTQKLGFLPEPIGDSIFAVLIEELGLVGGMGTIVLFGVLAWMLVSVARRSPDGFGGLLAAGMCLWIMGQAVVNIGAVTGLAPLTGIPLPFISYGGSSMVFMLAGLGLVLSVADRVS